MHKEFIRTTESTSLYTNIEKSSTLDILQNINTEDKKVAIEVEKQIPQIQLLVDAAAEKLANGGRLFYIGAGTSGRLGLVDASECPPTFGVSADLITGIIAGGQNSHRDCCKWHYPICYRWFTKMQRGGYSNG
ncbi:MAG: hypothetical protein LW603_06455 [Sediminibacterium sp.]|nr:hypothetical protein [Sediminibacterium sp.]